MKGRKFLTAGSIMVLVMGMLAGAAGSALAVHNDNLFELDTSTSSTVCNPITQPCGDANTADSPAGGADDWANVYKSATGLGTAGPDHAFGRTFITDPVSSAETSFYTGGGSKDVTDIPQWAHANTNDVVPDKDDLANAFAAAYVNPADSHTQIYFGVDRYDNNGDAETGFWFFQNRVSLNADGTFSGIHRTGDVLVLADWGGSNPVGALTVYSWVGGKNPLQLVSDSVAGGADCAKVALTDNVCAVVNRQLQDGLSGRPATQPWPFLDKNGSTVIRPLELFEAGLDVTALFGADRCFASFLASTRSSHSTTAQLKDFALGGFEQCGASITISPNAVNEVGANHTFNVHVSKTVGGTPQPAAGVTPTVTLTAANGAAVVPVSDTCAAPGTNATGDCAVTFTSNTAGTVTGHATASVTIGTETFNVATDGVAPNSSDAVKRFVDLQIDLSPLTATNEVNDEHEITATVQQNDGLATGGDGVDGWAPAVGATVDFSLLLNDANAVFVGGDDDCVTGAAGTCLITITTSDPGDVDIHATTTFSVGGVSMTRTTNTGGNNSADANKVFVDGYITIAPDATNPVGVPHTFTVTVFKNLGLGDGYVAASGEHVTFTLTNGGSAAYVLDAAASTCDNAGPNTNASGQCLITFVSDTPGTVTGHASVTMTLGGVSITRATDGDGNNSDDAVKTYITGAIRILKNSTKGGPVLQAGAVFSVDGSLLDADFEVIDNGTNDGDPDVGEICVGGVTPGDPYTVNEVTAPEGYGDATETDVVITAVSGTCTTAVFGDASTATFVNPPLFDIQVRYRDGGSTETSLVGTITCDNPTGTGSAADTDEWDDTLTVTGIEVPVAGEITLNCTLTVDP